MLVRTLLAALALFASMSSHAANRPPGYVTLCNEGKLCVSEKLQRVAFGRSDTFFYRELEGGFYCNEATFGGRVAGGVNECSIPKPASSSSSSRSSSSSSLSSSSSSSSSSSVSLYPARFGCVHPTGEVLVADTIVVAAGTTFDGGCKRYRLDPNSPVWRQWQFPPAMMKINAGATVKNMIIANTSPSDRVHTYGDATLQNLSFEDAPEGAIVIKSTGTVTLNGGFSAKSVDKVFQINAPSTLKISNFAASNGVKMIRQNGGTTFKIDVFLDRVDVRNMSEAIFRTDSTVSTVTMTNSNYCNVGRKWVGVNPANIHEANNTECGPGF